MNTLSFNKKCNEIKYYAINNVIDLDIVIALLKRNKDYVKYIYTYTKKCIEFLEANGVTVLNQEALQTLAPISKIKRDKSLHNSNICSKQSHVLPSNLENPTNISSIRFLPKCYRIKCSITNNYISVEDIILLLNTDKHFSSKYYILQCIDYLEYYNIKVLNKENLNEIFLSNTEESKSYLHNDEFFYKKCQYIVLNLVNNNQITLELIIKTLNQNKHFKRRFAVEQCINYLKSQNIQVLNEELLDKYYPIRKTCYLTDEEFINIVNKCDTMAEAARLCNMKINTFKRKAIKLGVYKPSRTR